jgi:DNA-binding response OmpR family regulator
MTKKKSKKTRASASKKVLVVEDDPMTLDLIKQVLKNGGITAGTANNGEECLEALKKEQPALILLDIMMPGMSGWDVYERMRKQYKGVKVIFVSAIEVSEDRKKALMNQGLAGYIIKPFSPDDLIRQVRAALK